jgi:hypothetical protein
LIVESIDEKPEDRAAAIGKTQGWNRENAVLLTGAAALP